MRGERDDVAIVDGWLAPERCRALLDAIEGYRQQHPLPLVERDAPGRPLRYRVIDGDAIYDALPELVGLYAEVRGLVAAHWGLEVTDFADRRVALNVNITPPGGTYRWHYDRNPLTAVAYLNEIPGGETEIYAGYRVLLGRWRHTAAQRGADRLMQTRPLLALLGRSRYRQVAARAGRLVLMRGDRCLHSVRPVAGPGDRVAVVMAYDRPGHRSAEQGTLDAYLYSSRPVDARDPNYQR